MEMAHSILSNRGGTCCEKLCWACLHIIYLVDFSSSNYAEFRGGELGNAKQNRVRPCTKVSRVGPTSPAYSDADPGLVCPTAAADVAAGRRECPWLSKEKKPLRNELYDNRMPRS